jgi:hypothetical protein
VKKAQVNIKGKNEEFPLILAFAHLRKRFWRALEERV